MAKAKVIVFDLFDTLIREVDFHFSSGLSYLHENILSEDTDKVDFLNYVDKHWKVLFEKRNEDNSELPFEDELLDFKNKYGFKSELSMEEIQYNCVNIMNTIELFEDTIPALEELKALGIPVYLLSNSAFKRKVMNRYIDQYDLEKYFVNTHYSSDYRIKKPHKDLFQIVYDDIKKYDNSIKMNEIYFVGDNFKADVLGSGDFGFTPVFLNREQAPGTNKEKVIEISNLKEILEVIR